MKAYSRYIDSGIGWLGPIPSGWSVCKLKHVLDMQSGESLTAERISPDGDYPVYGGNGLRGFTSAYTHEGAYVLIGRQGALCGNINYAEGRFWATEHAVVATPKRALNNRFLGELLRVMNLNQYSESAAQPGLSVAKISNLMVPLVPLAEQQRIGAYLDHTSALIDQLIEKNTALLDLLDQQRKAIINEAVTRGLDPKAPMKESGIGWLGEVPASWTVLPLRILGSLQNGVSAGAEYFGDGSPFVSYGDVYRNMALPEQFQGRAMSTKEDKERYSLLEGDVLFTRTSETIDEIGIASTCLRDIPEAVFAGFLIRFRPHLGKLFPGFSKYYFRSKGVREFLASEVNLVTRASLSQELLKRLPVCLPQFEEQRRLAGQIDESVSRIGSLEQMVRECIDRLKEYRQSIISEAVTGKIDLREWQPEPQSLVQ